MHADTQGETRTDDTGDELGMWSDAGSDKLRLWR